MNLPDTQNNKSSGAYGKKILFGTLFLIALGGMVYYSNPTFLKKARRKRLKGRGGKQASNTIINSMRRLGYTVLDDGRWNIVGIRANTDVPNSFDDEIHIIRKLNDGTWENHYYQITTDPGLYYLNNPMNVKGTGIMAPGQYKDAYGWGHHKGQYEALTQQGPVSAYRDSNRDNKIDYNISSIQTGMYGMNIHKAGDSSTSVDKWSAGCQVFKRSSDFSDFKSKLKTTGQKKFTYTLMTAKQVH
jgi:hypothetical protein